MGGRGGGNLIFRVFTLAVSDWVSNVKAQVSGIGEWEDFPFPFIC